MKILAIEFSSSRRSVAIVEEQSGPAPMTRSATSETGPGAVHALRLVDRALKEAGLEPNDIQCLAIGLGPGSSP
ncbi:MAG: hypothetical protein M1608_07790, partial [Candidatus Omnitrophica bacterium]|nr:hypothetical protein [Candidatus Omnitrophota bacterium]